jgi:hypothetical protein
VGGKKEAINRDSRRFGRYSEESVKSVRQGELDLAPASDSAGLAGAAQAVMCLQGTKVQHSEFSGCGAGADRQFCLHFAV